MPPKDLTAIRALNLARMTAADYTPVGVFVGGTSGIGQAMAESFACMTKGCATIVIVGRNQSSAESIIANLPQAPESKYEFVKCDATLMRNVEAVSREIVNRHPKVNFLVMSPGFISVKGFDVSAEGIDRKLATVYYARWKFTDLLLPALRRANEEGEEAKVFSVLGAGLGGPVDVNDFGLKKSFSVLNAALAGPTYNDLMMEEYAARNPDLTFIHASPGTVSTNFAATAESPTIRFLAPVIKTIIRTWANSPADCADYMWNAILSNAKGAFRTGQKEQDIQKWRYYGDEEQRKALWEHTVEAVNVK